MANNYAVVAYGKDPSGRTVYLTVYMHDWWEGVVSRLGFRPTIVQGAFMVRNGGGAGASAGYHDAGGCMDVRIWDLTEAQQAKLVRECRRSGAAAWLRSKAQGFDPHCHITLGADRPLSAGAKASWESYLAGKDGLADNRPDYHWRPDPLVLVPPKILPPPPPPKPSRGGRVDAAIKAVRELRNAKGGKTRMETINAAMKAALKALRGIRPLP